MSRFKKYEDKGLSGLANIGNTCYINACLQILSHTYELNNLLDKLPTLNINKNIESIILKEWDELRKMMWNQNCIIAPMGFVKAVQNVAKNKDLILFTSYDQNDIGEFFNFMIDSFHEALKREVNMNITGETESSVDELAIVAFKMMQNRYKKEYSEIINLFYGISITQIKSFDNSKCFSKKADPFSTLMVPIPNQRECTIFDCLDEFIKDEELTGENKWYNDKTKQYLDVRKNSIFWNLPEILIINLKRYGNNNRKIHTLVTTQFNNVDFSKYISGYNPKEFVYDLFGTAIHSGGTLGGHYTSNIRNANGKWYNINDKLIREINEKDVINQHTYCLFYRKIL
mgnify:CR=1 FL=1